MDDTYLITPERIIKVIYCLNESPNEIYLEYYTSDEKRSTIKKLYKSPLSHSQPQIEKFKYKYIRKYIQDKKCNILIDNDILDYCDVYILSEYSDISHHEILDFICSLQ